MSGCITDTPPAFISFFKAFLQINILTCTYRYRCAVFKPHILIGIYPWNHILKPCKIVRLHASGKSYAVLDADVAEMVYRQRHLIAYNLPYLFNIVFKIIKALFGKVNTCKRMCRSYYRVAFCAFYHVGSDRTALNIQYMGRIFFSCRL